MAQGKKPLEGEEMPDEEAPVGGGGMGSGHSPFPGGHGGGQFPGGAGGFNDPA